MRFCSTFRELREAQRRYTGKSKITGITSYDHAGRAAIVALNEGAIIDAQKQKIAELEEYMKEIQQERDDLLESYELAVGPESPLPELAKDVLRGFFIQLQGGKQE